MESKMIKKVKWFWGWADEKEEAWLGEMAQQGWHLRRLVFPTVYEFEQGEPKEVNYRLDYNAIGRKEKDNYLQLFADAGWEHVGEASGWQYFRKEARPGEPPEIFTDNESKIEKYMRLISLFAALLPVCVVTIMSSFDHLFFGFWAVVQVLALGILVLFSVAIFKILRRIKALKEG